MHRNLQQLRLEFAVATTYLMFMFVHPQADKLKQKLAELDRLKISTRYKTSREYRQAVDSAITEIELTLLGLSEVPKARPAAQPAKTLGARGAAFDRLPLGTKFSDIIAQHKKK